MDSGFVAVAGGVNVDIGAQSFAPLLARDSNPGRVTVSLGGVGRNIAHNLSLLGVQTELLTAIGDDVYTIEIRRSCAALGIGLSHALHVPGQPTSTYVYLNGPDGDMQLAVSDMRVCEHLTPDYFAAQLPLLREAALVVADANLSADSLRYLAENCTVPLFVDTVSTIKAPKIRGILPRIHTLKPNRMEAELLSGVPVSDWASAERAARKLLSMGVQRVFLSMGMDGLLAAGEGETVWQPAIPADTRNATGAGDALMAAMVWSFLHGESLSRSAALGAAASSLAVESEQTINPSLSAQAVRRRAEL